MARKTVERNISYDDIRKIYYVSMDLGKDKEGKRVKRYQTYRTLYAARMGLRNFLTHREEELRTPKHDLTLADWLKIQLPRVADASRCEWCCQSRLEAAALKAGELGFDAYTSSLLYSRYQPHEAIAAKGRDLSGNGGPEFIYRDFRVDWQEGIERSKDMGLYRQPYCGCVFSETERYGKKLARLARAAKDMAATEK